MMKIKRNFQIGALIVIFLLSILSIKGEVPTQAVSEAPLFMYSLAAPWPAGITLHAAKDGYGYGPGPTHRGTDLYAMDFNGWPIETETPVETNDKDLLVLSVADGCVKKVAYDAGHWSKDENGDPLWVGNYGWNVVIAHIGGYEVRYAHLKDPPLLPLQSYSPDSCYFVSQGQPLGQIGGTGTKNDSAIHLHMAMYYCATSNPNCTKQPVRPEPLDSVSNLIDGTKITSQNFGVGYEAMVGDTITNTSRLVFHQPIFSAYKSYGGQSGFFGRSLTPVKQFGSTPYFYQLFAERELVCAAQGMIFEADQQAYVMTTPIWERYSATYPEWGLPRSSTYQAKQGDGDYGWRSDFTNAVVMWNPSLTDLTIWEGDEAPWRGMFCPGSNNYMCSPVRRLDPYINFTFPDSNNPGPLNNTQGFSALWETTLDGRWFSNIGIAYEIQGHVRFYVNDDPITDWIAAEEGISGQIDPRWMFNANTFAVRFWQAAGKEARILVEVSERGIIPQVSAAFYPDEDLGSTAFQWIEGEYADYDPPPYPGDGSDFPVPTDTLPEITPTTTPPDLPDIELPDVEGWWDNFWNSIGEAITDWWQGVKEQMLQSLEEAVIKALNDLLESIFQPCMGPSALVMTMCVGFVYRKRHRRR